MVFHPGEERGPDIKACVGVVVDDLDDPSPVIQDPGGRIGLVAFCRDPLVPVVVGVGGILCFNLLQPRISRGGW